MSTNSTLKVIAVLQAKKGKVNALRQVLTALIEPSRREPGCIQYLLLNSPDRSSDFVFFEEWQSRQDLDEHMVSAHFKKAVNALDGLIAAAPEIRRYKTIDPC